MNTPTIHPGGTKVSINGQEWEITKSSATMYYLEMQLLAEEGAKKRQRTCLQIEKVNALLSPALKLPADSPKQ